MNSFGFCTSPITVLDKPQAIVISKGAPSLINDFGARPAPHVSGSLLVAIYSTGKLFKAMVSTLNGVNGDTR